MQKIAADKVNENMLMPDYQLLLNQTAAITSERQMNEEEFNLQLLQERSDISSSRIFVGRYIKGGQARFVELSLDISTNEPCLRLFDAFSPKDAAKCAVMSLTYPKQLQEAVCGLSDWKLEYDELLRLISFLREATDPHDTEWGRLYNSFLGKMRYLYRKKTNCADSQMPLMLQSIEPYEEMCENLSCPCVSFDGKEFYSLLEKERYEWSLSDQLGETEDSYFVGNYFNRNGIRSVEVRIAEIIHEPYFRVYDGSWFNKASKCARISIAQPRQIRCSDGRWMDWKLDKEEAESLVNFLQSLDNEKKYTHWYRILHGDAFWVYIEEDYQEYIREKFKWHKEALAEAANKPMPDYLQMVK